MQVHSGWYRKIRTRSWNRWVHITRYSISMLTAWKMNESFTRIISIIISLLRSISLPQRF
jgi:hypothetical protein